MPYSILFCCPVSTDARLGAAKVYIEAAEAFRRIGWSPTVVGPDEVSDGDVTNDIFERPYSLREYLKKNAAAYDVVEYEHHALPFPRNEFNGHVLFVARSVLLSHAQLAANIPTAHSVRSRLGKLFFGEKQREWLKAVVKQSDSTISQADFVNVCNDDEKKSLLNAGHASNKLGVFPFGLFPERLAAFVPTPRPLKDGPVIAFVGTFDPRKGMLEFPQIVKEVVDKFPTVRFKLIGTRGLLSTTEDVLRRFPHKLRSYIDVFPVFSPDQLPSLLSECHVGLFPSYCEGFPFGVLEMLAAGIPVVAYDAPGAPMMLPKEDLVKVGDGRALGVRIVELLGDFEKLREKQIAAARIASAFSWELTIRATASTYERALLELRKPL